MPFHASRFWSWKGYRIRYQRSGDSGPAVLLVHGFGGNADHWRKNTPVLGQRHRAYAIDLLGYGYSDKPDPRCAGVAGCSVHQGLSVWKATST